MDTLERMEQTEMRSDLFRTMYERVKAKDVKQCAETGDTPLTHADYVAIVQKRIQSME